MTTDDDDFPFPVNADAVRKYFVKETRWTKRIKSPGKKKGASRRTKKKRKVRAKVRDKMKKCTPGKSKTRKGGLGKNGYPGGLKTRKGDPAKRGIKAKTTV